MTNATPQTIPIGHLIVGGNVRASVGSVIDLAASIHAVGLLNPLTVRVVPAFEGEEPATGVELVAGHRRLAAVRSLGWTSVPVVFVEADADRLTIQLVENLQREDLGPMEEARGLAELVDLVGSQKAAAAAIGKSTAHVSKRLALLKLAEPAAFLVAALPIEDVVELARLDPKTQAKIARKVEGDVHPRTVRAHIESETRELSRKAESRKAASAAAKDKANRGLEVVDAGQLKSGWRTLEGYGALEVDRDAHAKEPCHRVVVGFLHSWDAEIRSEEFCADPGRHGPDGESKLKTEDRHATRQAEWDKRNRQQQADAEANRARWWAVATQAVETLDRNDALKVLSLYVLGSMFEDEGRADLRGILEAIGIGDLPAEPESGHADEAWAAYAEAIDAKVDGLTIAQTYRAAVLWVLDNTAASPAQWQRERTPAPAIADLLGIADPKEEV